MHHLRRIIRATLLTVATAALLAGCGKLTSTVVGPAGAPAPAGEQALLGGLVGGVTDLLRGLVSVTFNVVGAVGGKGTNGRWTVTFPPRAVEGNAVVGIGVRDKNSSEVQLEILPAACNDFKVPVTLTIDCRNVPLAELQTYTIFWFDPATGRWVPVPGTKVDLSKKTCSAPLEHFSRYKAGRQGKAGW